MTFSSGTKVGAYEIVGLLGAGGMGEVYRARDSKLKREVAIKVLPVEFSRDAERVLRFKREAEVVASLNHPSVAAIHELGESGETLFLVLELVEGQTLADRIAAGAIPLDEALRIAKQIAEALETTHEKRIIHRDLKPANVMLTASGNVKVLDFGLAKVHDAESTGANVSDSPTRLTAAPGMIFGTAAYLSPERAKGQEADSAADVWAFGCVLYEMLTGRRVFEGESVAEILGEVIKTEPDWGCLPAVTPAGIRRLLRRCLQKDRRERLQHIGDARIEIGEALNGTPAADVVEWSGPRPKSRLAWITLSFVTLVSLIATAVILWFRPAPSEPAEMRFDIATPPTTDPMSLAISPDGQKIILVATSEGRSRLWLRSLDSTLARPLSGTDGARFPFWAHDNRSVGFIAEGKLKLIDIEAGSARTLVEAASSGSWNQDNLILYTPNQIGPIMSISAAGGGPSPVTRLEAQQTSHVFPHFLPDGRHFLYYARGSPEVRGVYAGRLDGPLDGSQTRRLLEADTAAVYASSGHLLFVRQGTLFAQKFDPIRLELSGDPFSVAQQLAVDSIVPYAALSASVAGPIVYRVGSHGGQRQLVWFDRSGVEVGRIGDPIAGSSNPSMSPDGRNVALTIIGEGNADVWLLEIARGGLRRLTFDPGGDVGGVWSPDGRRVAFGSNRSGGLDPYEQSINGAPGSEKLLMTSPRQELPMAWSPDGRFLLYRMGSPNSGLNLWALPLQGDGKPIEVVQTPFEDRDGQFSPDGKWIAYQSNESGRFEIYIQPFLRAGGRSAPISTNGGAQVRWRRDGRELFYIALDGQLMAAPIELPENGDDVKAGRPVPLFTTRVGGALQGPLLQQYDVSPDGRQFLMNVVMEEGSSPITVILNWKPR